MAEDPAAYGGFSVGAMQLSLPMAALREVVPCPGLTPLPCRTACVLGGIDVRGVTVPVVDLRRLLGVEGPASEFPSVLLMAHHGLLLGLLADAVGSIFIARSTGPKTVVANPAGTERLFAGCVRDDAGTTFSVLSPSALARLEGVPLIADPEPGRQALAETGAAVEIDSGIVDALVPVMFVQCGAIGLAIEATSVHATLSHLDIDAGSVLARGHCRGVISYAGARVPAVDLAALCGLGSLDQEDIRQAFVIKTDVAMVALLVTRVVDIARVGPALTVAIPAWTLDAPSLYAGVMTASSVFGDDHKGGPSTYFVLDGNAVKRHELVAALGQTNTPIPGEPGLPVNAGASISANARGVDLLTYEVGTSRVCTPLGQIVEILTVPADFTRLERRGPLQGLMVDRGRSIPIVSLASVLGQAPSATDSELAGASTLVVETGSGLAGFAVGRLNGIEAARWQPAASDSGERSRRAMALVGSGTTERMLTVVDLQGLAARLPGGIASARVRTSLIRLEAN